MKWCSILLALFVFGCAAAGGGKTTDNINKAKNLVSQQAGTLSGIGTALGALTPKNLPDQKPALAKQVQAAQVENVSIGKALDSAATSAKKDEATIASASDPVKVRLNWAAVVCFIAGVLGCLGGVFLSSKLGYLASWFRSGGAALAVGGVALYLIGAFLLPLIHIAIWAFWISLGVGLVVAGVWAYLHRSSLIPVVETWFNKIEAGIEVDLAGSPVTAPASTATAAAPAAVHATTATQVIMPPHAPTKA
jgi:hypothetical protein